MGKFLNLAGTTEPFRLARYAVAELPAAASYSRYQVWANDAVWSGGTGCPVWSDGTNWRDPDGRIAQTGLFLPKLSRSQQYGVLDATLLVNLPAYTIGAMQVYIGDPNPVAPGSVVNVGLLPVHPANYAIDTWAGGARVRFDVAGTNFAQGQIYLIVYDAYNF
jgi:hypothetical protein